MGDAADVAAALVRGLRFAAVPGNRVHTVMKPATCFTTPKQRHDIKAWVYHEGTPFHHITSMHRLVLPNRRAPKLHGSASVPRVAMVSAVLGKLPQLRTTSTTIRREIDRCCSMVQKHAGRLTRDLGLAHAFRWLATTASSSFICSERKGAPRSPLPNRPPLQDDGVKVEVSTPAYAGRGKVMNSKLCHYVAVRVLSPRNAGKADGYLCFWCCLPTHERGVRPRLVLHLPW